VYRIKIQVSSVLVVRAGELEKFNLTPKKLSRVTKDFSSDQFLLYGVTQIFIILGNTIQY